MTFLFLFLVLINDAGFKNIKDNIGLKITQAINKRTELQPTHWKYVDDLTVAESLKLKESLVNDDEEILDKPLTYHNRNNQVLPQLLSTRGNVAGLQCLTQQTSQAKKLD